MEYAATGSQRSGGCLLPNQDPVKCRTRPQTPKQMIPPATSLVPNAVAQWSSWRPSCEGKHQSPALHRGRMPHDKTRKTGLALCGRRTSQCGILRKSDATSRPQRQNGTSTGNVMLDTSPGRRRLSSQSRSLSASDAAAVTNNPHSIENLPALSSLSDLSPLQLTLTAATNLRQTGLSLPVR